MRRHGGEGESGTAAAWAYFSMQKEETDNY
jgi:hypothetical protein